MKTPKQMFNKPEKIIIHCSATPEGRDVHAEDIRRWHKSRGWYDIGYHYVIEIDGTIRAGRKEDVIGAHCRGQNDKSIGICYVGGCCEEMEPKDTLNELQEESLKNLICYIRDGYGELPIHGHNEFSNKACPSFDVSERLDYLMI